MGAFNDVMENAKSAASTIGKKAALSADNAKLKLQITGIKHDIANAYKALGEKTYELICNGDFSENKIEKDISKIEELYSQLGYARALIDDNNGKKSDTGSRCGKNNCDM